MVETYAVSHSDHVECSREDGGYLVLYTDYEELDKLFNQMSAMVGICNGYEGKVKLMKQYKKLLGDQ